MKITQVKRKSIDELQFPILLFCRLGSAVALMRLQDTYKLNSSQFANGELSSKYKSRKLNAVECYDLGRVAYSNGDYYHTLLWMQEALNHLNTETNTTYPAKLDVLDHLAYATSQVHLLIS